MNELFEVHAGLDGYVLRFEGYVIFRGTLTGCARAMIAARNVGDEAATQLERLLAVHARRAA